MRANVAIRHQPVTRQVNENTLRVLVRKIKDLPLVLGQFALPRDGYRLHVGTLWQRAKYSNCPRRQEQRTRPGQQKAQRIAARDNLVLVPGVRELFAPFLVLRIMRQARIVCWLWWIRFLNHMAIPFVTPEGGDGSAPYSSVQAS